MESNIIISDPNNILKELEHKNEMYFNWISKNGHTYLICIDSIYKDINYNANRIKWIVYKNLYNIDDDFLSLKAWYLQSGNSTGEYHQQNTLETKYLWDTYYPLSKEVENICNEYRLIIFDIMN